jgi:hypothetical protein
MARWLDSHLSRIIGSDKETFYSRFYGDSGIPEEIPIRLRQVFAARIYGIWKTVTPQTNPVRECDDIDIEDVFREIEEEFGLSIPEQDKDQLDGSFDGFVRYLANRRNKE